MSGRVYNYSDGDTNYYDDTAVQFTDSTYNYYRSNVLSVSTILGQRTEGL